MGASLNTEERRTLERSVRELTGELAALAADLGDREARQRAADRAFEVATTGAGSDAKPDSTLAAGVIAVRVLAIDLMVFAGVEVRRRSCLGARRDPRSPSSRAAAAAARADWLAPLAPS